MLIGQRKKRYASQPLLYSNVVEERAYQTKIAQDAYNRNTLVILPTALGKTVISAGCIFGDRSARFWDDHAGYFPKWFGGWSWRTRLRFLGQSVGGRPRK